MLLTEYADSINKHLDVKYNYCLRMWQVKFYGAEIKDSGMLRGVCGSGITFSVAFADYVNQIVGKTIVFNAYGGVGRQEFIVPKYLSCNEER